MNSSLRKLLCAVTLLVACGENVNPGPSGLGGPCTNNGTCRTGLTCGPSGTCQANPTIAAGSPCSLTAQCLAGLYCNAFGVCATAGSVGANGTCTDTSSCQRGLVCARNAPGLYGVCSAPNGVTVMGSGGGGDGGVTSGSDGGPTMGASGTAHDVGGSCRTVLDCFAGLSCGTSHTCISPNANAYASLWTGERCADDIMVTGATGKAYFEVPALDGTPPHDFFRLPFPNDARRDPATGRINLTGFPHPGNGVLGFDLVDRYARASEQELDGFGTNQQIYFRFSVTPDFGTLRLGETVQLLDLTAGGPTSSLTYSVDTGRNQYLCANNLTVSTGSGSPLVPGHTYAALLTTGITDGMHRPLGRDADFVAMLGATAPSDARLARAYAAYAPLRSYLTMHSISPDTLLVATVFTTQSARARLPALRDAVQSAPAAMATNFVRCDTGVRSPCDDGLTGAAHVRGCMGAADPRFEELQGRVDVPVFQQGTRPYRNAGEGALAVDAMGRVMLQRTEQVCVTVTIPRGAPMPSGGWPVVLYGHGTGGSYRNVVSEGLASALSSVDSGGMTVRFATVGYEGVMHGDRRGMGVTDPPDTLFFNFANPQAARDNVLQGAADVLALVRALGSLSLPMLPATADTTRFDAQRIYFVGHSQGSTVGALALPYESGIAAAVLSGAGGDLRVSLATKRNPVDIASLGPLVLLDRAAGAGHPAYNLFQAYFERADAVNYGALVFYQRPMGVPARPVVQTYGLGDTYSTIETMQAFASSMGIPVASPAVGAMPWPASTIPLPVMDNLNTASGPVTGVLLEADPGGAYDGHFVLQRDSTLQARVLGFLASAALGHAVVR